MTIRYLAVYTAHTCGPGTGGQGYILDVYDDDEMRRYKKQLKWRIVSEHDGPREAWAAVRQAMRAHDPETRFVSDLYPPVKPA